MKAFFRGAAAMLILLQLFTVTAAADGEVSASVIEKMIAAASGTVVTSGAAINTIEPSKQKAETEANQTDGASGAEKTDEFVPHELVYGTSEDVNIGGMEIHAGRWYTVVDGELTESAPWPDSYLYYSASQSKITLHEFHYTVKSDNIGKGELFAALYVPKNITIVLEGENELLNRSYTTIDGRQVSNGVYAGNNKITFDGNGTLLVNTRSDDGMAGYGIAAGHVRINGSFIGLSVFGASGAFCAAPSFNEAREVIARRADLHPEYNGDVTVKDANPYNESTYTRYRYVLFAIGKELSPQQKIQAMISAQYAQAQMDYDDAVDVAITEFNQNFAQELDTSINDFNLGLNDGIAEMNAGIKAWENEASQSVSFEDWQNGNVFAIFE